MNRKDSLAVLYAIALWGIFGLTMTQGSHGVISLENYIVVSLFFTAMIGGLIRFLQLLDN